MNDHPNPTATIAPGRDAADGLSAADLDGEIVQQLPDRDALSVVGIGGIEAGLPLPPAVEDALASGLGELHDGLAELPVGALAGDPGIGLLDVGAGLGTEPLSEPIPAESTKAAV